VFAGAVDALRRTAHPTAPTEDQGQMDFELTDDQRDLQDAARDVITKDCTAEFVRSVVDDGVDPIGWWHTLVELYWPAIAIPETSQGLGLTWVELAIVVEELGRAIDPSPFLATTTQFAPTIAHCASSEQATHLLESVATGAITGAVAFAAHTVRATAAPPTDAGATGGWRLTGTAEHVVDADRADTVAVVAGAGDQPAVFLVPRADLTSVTLIEGVDPTTHLTNIELTDVFVPAHRRLEGADVAAGITAAYEEATLGWALSSIGASQRILDLVLAHVTTRHQFGKPIGSFQAVKHKAVDIYIAIERARATAQFAALTIAEGDQRRSVAVSMAKAAAGDAQRVAFQNGFQLFGGMGFTWENDLNFALRRAKLGALMFGSTSTHRRRVAVEVLAG
jgi:alkylation response protein AidB-like acyl-CoA dehydrogenase